MKNFELSISRTFDAPMDLVYEVWTSAEHMKRWLGPKEFTCTAMEMDFRIGGKWRACIVAEKYGENWMGGVYREITPNERIVFSFAWEDGRDQPGVEQLVTVTFREENGKTVQTFHQGPFLHEEARDGHVGGWNQVFDKELAYLEGCSKEKA